MCAGLRDPSGALVRRIRLAVLDERHLQGSGVGVLLSGVHALEAIRDGDQLARRGAAVQRPEGALAPAEGEAFVAE